MHKSEIKDVLIELQKKFDAIFSLFDSPSEGVSSKENLKLISSQYSELKDYVNEYHNTLNKSKDLSADQRSFLLPAIEEIVLHCKARKGSMNKDELISSLYDGSDYCSFYIGQLCENKVYEIL